MDDKSKNINYIYVKTVIAKTFLLPSGPLAPFIKNYFTEYDIENFTNKFISLKAILEILNKIYFHYGPYYLFKIGEILPTYINFKENILPNLPVAILTINNEYYLHHTIIDDRLNIKKSDVLGKYELLLYDSQKVVVKSSTPYPCDFDKGIFYKIVSYFYPHITIKNIYHNSKQCKLYGQGSCIYEFNLTKF
jgi:hypothetical protein